MSSRARRHGFRVLIIFISCYSSIKNNITNSIAHIYIVNKPLIKTVYHVVNITSTEAELFAIRCGINQLLYFNNISKTGGRDGIVEETPVHVYYAYLKPTWGYGFNSLVVLYVG